MFLLTVHILSIFYWTWGIVLDLSYYSSCFYSSGVFLVSDGRQERVMFDKITSRIQKLCYGLNAEFVDPVSYEIVLMLHQNLFLRSTISVDATDSMTKSSLCKDFYLFYYYLLLCFIYFYILIILFGCFNLIYLLYYFCHFNPFGTFYFSLIRPPSLTWGPQFENPWPSYYYSLLFIKQ